VKGVWHGTQGKEKLWNAANGKHAVAESEPRLLSMPDAHRSFNIGAGSVGVQLTCMVITPTSLVSTPLGERLIQPQIGATDHAERLLCHMWELG
jgi:hypothetical protein